MAFNKFRTRGFIMAFVASCMILTSGEALANPIKKQVAFKDLNENIMEDLKYNDSVYQPVCTDNQELNNEGNKPFFKINEFHSSWGCCLDGNHRKMTGTLYLESSSSIKIAHLDFYGDNKFIRSYTLKAGEEPIIINEDVTNIKEFSIVSNLQMTSNLSGDEIIKLGMAFKEINSKNKFGDITIE